MSGILLSCVYDHGMSLVQVILLICCCQQVVNRICGVMVIACSPRVKPKAIKLVLVASPLRRQSKYISINLFGFRITCPSGAFVQYKADIIIISSNITCPRHNITPSLPHSLTHFFCSITEIENFNDLTPDFHDCTGNRIDTLHITSDEVKDILECLQVGKAVGSDLISHCMLKNTSSTICKPLQ